MPDDIVRASVGGDVAEAVLFVGIASGGISGDVEGTLTSDQTLAGDVNLTGDLIVENGAVLSAGPGVDVEGNGFQLLFADGASADWQGTPTETWSADYFHNGTRWDATVTKNLDRDINFRNLSRIMWHSDAGPSTLKYFTVHDSGGPELGFYPLHWHLNHDTTRGTFVEGAVVRGGKHHAYVPHGSHGVTFRDCIAVDTHESAFWWDPPGTNDCDAQHARFCTADNSNDTVIERMLVDGVTEIPGVNNNHLSGFVLGAGSGNEIRDSVAVNVVGPNHPSAYTWPSHANMNDGGNVWLFENNFGTSTRNGWPRRDWHGIFVWQNDFNEHVVDGFRGGGISHGAYTNIYVYRNIDVPYMDVHAGGWRIESGHIGTLRLAEPQQSSPNDPTLHVENTQVDELVVDNGQGQVKTKPPTYDLWNIGLSCGDVQVVSQDPGTQLFIDGQEC